MANVREVAEFLMLTIAALGALSSLSRPDCNFPLFVYLWWTFFYVPEERKAGARIRIRYIWAIVFTVLILIFTLPILPGGLVMFLHVQQRFMVAFIFLSIVQDIFYILYWPIRWFAHDWLALSSDTEGLHVLVTFFALLEIGLKLLLLALLLIPGAGTNTSEAIKMWFQRLGQPMQSRDTQVPLLITGSAPRPVMPGSAGVAQPVRFTQFPSHPPLSSSGVVYSS